MAIPLDLQKPRGHGPGTGVLDHVKCDLEILRQRLDQTFELVAPWSELLVRSPNDGSQLSRPERPFESDLIDLVRAAFVWNKAAVMTPVSARSSTVPLDVFSRMVSHGKELYRSKPARLRASIGLQNLPSVIIEAQVDCEIVRLRPPPVWRNPRVGSREEASQDAPNCPPGKSRTQRPLRKARCSAPR